MIGGGQVGVTSYIIPIDSMSYWENRLMTFHINYRKSVRFGETYLKFTDVHGLPLELVERSEGRQNNWVHGDVTSDVAIKGFGGATLLSTNPDKTRHTLEKVMGLETIGANSDFIRFKSYGDIGNVIDVKRTSISRGELGVGTVHHVAWRAKDVEDQLAWQSHVRDQG